MHHLMFVLVNKDNGETSEDVRERVFERLSNDHGFVGQEDSAFGCPLADWFVIGGRWSGEITKLLLNQDRLNEFMKEFEKKHGFWVGGKEKMTEKIRQDQSIEMFKKHFPKFKAEHPFWRDAYRRTGFEDDAQVVTEKIWNAILKQYKTDSSRAGENPDVIDLDGDQILKKEVVGKKWIVVVDFHS